MSDLLSNITTIVTLIGSLVVIIGGIAALYVYRSRLKFAAGKWNIRSVNFYPPGVAKNIKLELTDWQQAANGEILPLETLQISRAEDGEYIPVGGLTSIKLKRTFNPPVVVLHFVVANPNITPTAIKDMTFTIQRCDGGARFEFVPAFFGKKEASDNVGLPAGLPLDEYWGPILMQPASSSEHRLVFVPKLGTTFEGLTEGEYKCAVELKFERFSGIIVRNNKLRRVVFKVNIDETMAKAWNDGQPITFPYGLIQDIG